MIWLLLTYVGYLAALSATLGAVGYVAATRFSLVQRLLATLVDRTLSHLADSEQAAYTVTHTDTGGDSGGISDGGSAASCRVVVCGSQVAAPQLPYSMRHLPPDQQNMA